MNSLSMESIFLALSGIILVAGVLYWFWSHIQLTQKKVQLLENAVFELRGMLQRGGPDPGPGAGPGDGEGEGPGPNPIPEPGHVATPASSAAPATSVYNDLSDDDWKEDVVTEIAPSSTPLESLDAPAEVAPDLQPGGRIEGVEPEAAAAATTEPEQFRDLFTKPVVSDPSSLDAMPVKDLRRLAEQRGIPNVSDLRKKEILSALKSQIVGPASSGDVHVEKAAEKTLDLTEVAEILE